MYAFPEMNNGLNGKFVEPTYWFFDKNNIPNPEVWNHRGKTIYSKKVDEKLVQSLSACLSTILNNRDTLTQMSLESYELANGKFSQARTIGQWKDLIDYCGTKHSKT